MKKWNSSQILGLVFLFAGFIDRLATRDSVSSAVNPLYMSLWLLSAVLFAIGSDLSILQSAKGDGQEYLRPARLTQILLALIVGVVVGFIVLRFGL